MHALRAATASGLILIGATALLSGGSGADPRTPSAVPGLPPPFLGTAVVGSGGITAAVDAYGDLVDLRTPGPAGAAQIDNSSARELAGTVAADTGIVVRAAADRRTPQPLWRGSRISQRYLRGTNVLRTTGTVAGVRLQIEDAATSKELVRRVIARPVSHRGVRLSLGVNLVPGTLVRCREHRKRALAARVSLVCSRGRPKGSVQEVIDTAARADRRWIARAHPLGRSAPSWARRMYLRSLLVLRALTDRRTGAQVAGARDGWAAVWPRDAGAGAIALARAGYRGDARRVARFVEGLDLSTGARFRGDGSAVRDGRVLPGDSAGWVKAATRAAGLPVTVGGAAWRGRGDYGERADDSGDYLANAIAAGAPVKRIEALFATPAGLVRGARDPSSGLDSAAAWAVRPFARPTLYPLVRRSLRQLLRGAGRFGLKPAARWPGEGRWTAPTAWTAWSLAALGLRREALRLIADLRRSATTAGTLPERLGAIDGVPRSTTPLAWSHAFTVLALRQLYP
jgi:hypothetical protein